MVVWGEFFRNMHARVERVGECAVTVKENHRFHLMRPTGIEPVSIAWKAIILPLNHRRLEVIVVEAFINLALVLLVVSFS